MEPREAAIRALVARGFLPPVEDVQWLLTLLDTMRNYHTEDTLVLAVSSAYGPSFVDGLMSNLWETVQDSVNERIES